MLFGFAALPGTIREAVLAGVGVAWLCAHAAKFTS